jgi:hypothetical protein
MKGDELFQAIFWGICVVGVVGALVFGSVQCTRMDRESYNMCVEKTQKPLECKAQVYR